MGSPRATTRAPTACRRHLRRCARSRGSAWQASTWDGVGVRSWVRAPAPRPPWRATRNYDSVVLALPRRSVLLPDWRRGGGGGGGQDPPGAFAVPAFSPNPEPLEQQPAFWAAAAPRVAVVSVGHHSRFGSPPKWSPVLGAGVSLLRTDRDGAVTLSTDGKGVWMTTYADGWTARIR